MKKIGSIQFYEDVDLNLNFTFDDLMEDFKKSTLGVKKEFLDENNSLKFDLIDKYVEEYVNKRIREKYGIDCCLDVMDNTLNISWNIKVETIKKHKTDSWWNKDLSPALKMPKLKKV